MRYLPRKKTEDREILEATLIIDDEKDLNREDFFKNIWDLRENLVDFV